MNDMESLFLYSILGLFVLVVILGLWITQLSKRILKLTQGAKGVSLENVIVNTNHQIKALHGQQEQHQLEINHLKETTQSSLQHLGIVRFNPYKNTGGSQSFAIALTDGRENGIIISSLYTRERVNVFAKPIQSGSSSFTLTEEEQSALDASRKTLT